MDKAKEKKSVHQFAYVWPELWSKKQTEENNNE
jgi:hypothetical protein